MWLLSQGRGFMTVRGLHVFGHHFTLDYFFFVPAYWLGAGPNFLNVVQVVVVGLGAVPLYLLARERQLGPVVASVLAGVFLLHPSPQFLTWELFHPETVAITPLLCAYLCSVRRSWHWFAFWSVLTVSCKEDMALPIMILGLLIALRGNRKVGLVTAGLAFAWFALITAVVIPAINDGGHLAGEFLQGVGGSPGGLVETAFTDPGAITSRLFSDEAGSYTWELLFPFGFIPLFSPLVLLMGLPQYLISLLADPEWMRVITFHYAAIPVAVLGIGLVEGTVFILRRVPRMPRAALGAFALACALVGSVTLGLSPIGDEYRTGYWPPPFNPRLETLERAVDLVPEDAGVSATYGFVPQLSHRAAIYSFPNPWQNRNWGVEGTPLHDPDVVEWLVLDRQVLSPEDDALVATIIGDFRVVFERDGVLVARRRGSP
jgi:uncharacterized membrane protein